MNPAQKEIIEACQEGIKDLANFAEKKYKTAKNPIWLANIDYVKKMFELLAPMGGPNGANSSDEQKTSAADS